MCMDEILLCVYKAQLDSDQTRLLFNPPCQLHVQMIQLISPNPNNVDSIDIPKSQNAFLLYRKNYAAKHKSLESKKDWKTLSKEAGNSWKNESDEVKLYIFITATEFSHIRSKVIYIPAGSKALNALLEEFGEFRTLYALQHNFHSTWGKVNISPKSALENILFAHVYTLEHQKKLIIELARFAEERCAYRLLQVINCIIALFRTDYAGRKKATNKV
ncbi:13220_t:CDS:2 [Entrophospora sp. SA101]|nr:13220_t:CDS:2 [Entrophospora sp. SA101]